MTMPPATQSTEAEIEALDRLCQRLSGFEAGITLEWLDGAMAALADLGVGRKIFLHINNSNPVLLPESTERQSAERAGWQIPFDDRYHFIICLLVACCCQNVFHLPKSNKPLLYTLAFLRFAILDFGLQVFHSLHVAACVVHLECFPSFDA